MSQNNIRVVGAREHNLKNITVEIPRDKLVVTPVFPGRGKAPWRSIPSLPKGSGVTSSRFRRMRAQFLGQMDKPDVDYIDGLSPAVSIDQKAPRTTRAPRWHGDRGVRLHAPAVCPGGHPALPNLRAGGDEPIGAGNRR